MFSEVQTSLLGMLVYLALILGTLALAVGAGAARTAGEAGHTRLSVLWRFLLAVEVAAVIAGVRAAFVNDLGSLMLILGPVAIALYGLWQLRPSRLDGARLRRVRA